MNLFVVPAFLVRFPLLVVHDAVLVGVGSFENRHVAAGKGDQELALGHDAVLVGVQGIKADVVIGSSHGWAAQQKHQRLLQ